MYIKKCRVCNSKKLKKILNFGDQPWCNDFLRKKDLGKEKKYPLNLIFCDFCKTPQLNFTVKKEIMFSNHTYLSGITDTLRKHFKTIAIDLNKKFNKNGSTKSILDIGSNDGTFLEQFKIFKWSLLGVESSKNICQIANKKKIKTLNFFFNEKIAKKIDRKFDFINASGVFFHLEELYSFTKGVKNLLNEKGVFIVQFLYMKSIVTNVAFDQIYHEHLIYYNLKNLSFLLNKFDLEIFDCYLTSAHGGQMVCYISHKKKYKRTKRLQRYIILEKKLKCNSYNYYKNFAKKVSVLKNKNIKFIDNCKKKKLSICGIGAPAKGNTLLNYFKISNKDISIILEKNKLRFGMYTPGSHILIKEEKKSNMNFDVFYVLAWNFKKEILKNYYNKYKNKKKFFFPINVKI
ncbi:C-methyltransferase family protein [alpha proteobacterium HIMB114]|nr:C-methyltransferase family protein [alpha proteobacterium HIMB114]